MKTKYRYPSSISTPEARKVYRRLMRKIKMLTESMAIYKERLFLANASILAHRLKKSKA